MLGFFYTFEQMNIEELYHLFQQYPNICTDSREIKKDSIFFALKGESFDGNEYAAEAIDKGCAFAVIAELKSLDEKFILVDDVLHTLQKLAKHHRDQLEIPVIGITGSNGKTTSKELISAVLSTEKRCYATKGNLNNHIGVPLSILEINHDHEIAIIEMGANHIGEIAALCEIAQPNLGIITNIGKAHLEGFGNLDGVIQAKTELYKYIKLNVKGKIFVNEDDDLLVDLAYKFGFRDRFLNALELNLYDSESREDYIKRKVNAIDNAKINSNFISTNLLNLVIAKAKGENSDSFINVSPQRWDTIVPPRYTPEGWGETIYSNLIGDYQFYNIALAITIGQYFHISYENSKKAIENYTPTNNRSEIIKTKNNTLILDAYNANPSSMKAMLTSFSKQVYKNKLCILGDMLELGEASKKEHKAILELTKKLSLETIFVGEEFSKVCSEAYEKTSALAEKISNTSIKNKTILLKGSRGIALEKLVDLL